MLKIFETVSGSRLYGTETSSSDIDQKGVFIPAAHDILLQQAPRTIQSMAPTHTSTKSPLLDLELFSIQHYLNLLVEGQTQALDMFFAPEKFWISRPTWHWGIIQESKNELLHSGMTAFVGYCKAQAARYGRKGERLEAVETALRMFSSITSSVRLSEVGETLDSLVRESSLIQLQVDVHTKAPSHLSICEKKFPMAAKVGLVRDRLEAMRRLYGSRAHSASLCGGMDAKAMMHAVRVALEAEELLLTGHITFPRPERKILQKIRSGEMPLAEVENLIDDGLARVQKAQLKSTLRESPHPTLANDLIAFFHARQILRHPPHLNFPQGKADETLPPAFRMLSLGTSSGIPTNERCVSGTVLQITRTGELWLFDCGEGILQQFMRSGLRHSKLRRVFITHLHSDHVLGLPALLVCHERMQSDKLEIFGPPGLANFISQALENTSSNILDNIIIREVTAGRVFAQPTYTVTCAPLKHRVPAFGYRVEIYRADRSLPPAIFAYCSDTTFCLEAVKLAHEADLLVHEATYADKHSDKGQKYQHSTARDAAKVAQMAGAKKLILSHYSLRYSPSQMTQLLQEAREEFPQTFLAQEFLSFSSGD